MKAAPDSRGNLLGVLPKQALAFPSITFGIENFLSPDLAFPTVISVVVADRNQSRNYFAQTLLADGHGIIDDILTAVAIGSIFLNQFDNQVSVAKWSFLLPLSRLLPPL